MSLPILSLTTFAPLVGALAILALPKANSARWIALGTTVVTFALSLVMLMPSTVTAASAASCKLVLEKSKPESISPPPLEVSVAVMVNALSAPDDPETTTLYGVVASPVFTR